MSNVYDTEKATVVRTDGYDIRLYRKDRGAFGDAVTVTEPDGEQWIMEGTWRRMGSRSR